MTFISFIYRIGNNPKTYYGKYSTSYISDDHDGLDEEVKHILEKSLNTYRAQRNLSKLKSKIHIGILSLTTSRFIPTYSTYNEIQCFDFYYSYKKLVYINGKLLR